jgi:hypothetical protein
MPEKEELDEQQIDDLPDRVALSVVTDSPINNIVASNFMNPGAVTSAGADQTAPITQGPMQAEPVMPPAIAPLDQPQPIE